MAEERKFGTGKGDVYPATAAWALTLPFRYLMHPPGRLARRLGLRPADRVLELGCGPGWFSPALASRLGPQGALHLSDLQPEMLTRARRRVRKKRRGPVTATAVDASFLPFRDGSFDAAVLAAVLGETPDPPRTIAEIARTLRPSGRLLVLETVTDPDRMSLDDVRSWAADAGLTLHRRHGRPGYTAVFVKDSGGSRLGS